MQKTRRGESQAQAAAAASNYQTHGLIHTHTHTHTQTHTYILYCEKLCKTFSVLNSISRKKIIIKLFPYITLKKVYKYIHPYTSKNVHKLFR